MDKPTVWEHKKDASLKTGEALVQALASGAKVNEPAWRGWTPLHSAVSKTDRTDSVLAFRTNEHARTNDVIKAEQLNIQARLSNGESMETIRRDRCNSADVRVLIAAGANVHAVNKEGFTPLHAAQNRFAIADLIGAGADPLACDQHGRTPAEHMESLGHGKRDSATVEAMKAAQQIAGQQTKQVSETSALASPDEVRARRLSRRMRM